jgi:uncharacterized membrane protein YsdA (DUF1294 family)
VDVVAVLALVALLLLALMIGYLLADRSARRRAWRRIAEERRRIREVGDRRGQ